MKATPDHSIIFGTWLIRVADWTPPTENKVMGYHWRRKEVYKKTVAELLGTYARICGVPLVTPGYRPVRRVKFTCVFESSLPDPHNLFKITLDAMRRSRLIVDDSATWLECPIPVMQRGTRDETVIEIANLRLGPPIPPEHDPDVKRFLARMKRKGKGGVRGPQA